MEEDCLGVFKLRMLRRCKDDFKILFCKNVMVHLVCSVLPIPLSIGHSKENIEIKFFDWPEIGKPV